MNSATAIRRVLLVLVLAGLGFAGWHYMHAGPVDKFGDSEAMLKQRMDQYLALRLADDWAALYPMADPAHRKEVDLIAFLAFYGQGYLKFNEIRVNATRINAEKRTAEMDLTSEAELMVERLPAKFRNVREPHPEHTHQSQDHKLYWVWADNDWYFQMDPEVVTGRTVTGEVVTLPQAPQSPPLNPLVPAAPGS